MAQPQHRAATDVTIARTQEESALHQFVSKYWPLATVIAVAVTAGILWRQWSWQQEQGGALASWTRVKEEVDLSQGINPPSASVLANLADELEDSAAGPWAKAIEVGKRLEDGDTEGARRALDELAQIWPDHPLTTQAFFARPSADGPPRTLDDHVEATLNALEAWKAEHSGLFANPPLPDDAPRVKMETSAGTLVIGLYEEQAPEHAENFLKLCREGFYDGIKFHLVIEGSMVQAGDPNTRDDEAPETWGQGGPGYTLEPEVGSLWHFRYAVAAAATRGGGPTSGSQFYIVTGDDGHGWDGDYTVFGTLVEGAEVVHEIESGPVLGERAQEPVHIVSTEVL